MLFKKDKAAEAAKRMNKQVKANRKKIETTLKWMDVDSVEDDCIILRRGKASKIIKGVKIQPRNIFIEDAPTVSLIIDRWRVFLNKFQDDLYWGFVYNPINIEPYLNVLFEKEKMTEDIVIRRMIMNDIEKAMMFCETYKELEFFLMVRADSHDDIEKRYFDLVHELRAEGIAHQPLCSSDFRNYLSNVFENELITDYTFNEGVFRSYQVSDFNEYGDRIFRQEQNEDDAATEAEETGHIQNESTEKESSEKSGQEEKYAKQRKKTVKTRKKWNDSVSPSEETQIYLLKDGVVVQGASLGPENLWAYEFKDLPFYNDGGNEAVYTVIEQKPEEGSELIYEENAD